MDKNVLALQKLISESTTGKIEITLINGKKFTLKAVAAVSDEFISVTTYANATYLLSIANIAYVGQSNY